MGEDKKKILKYFGVAVAVYFILKYLFVLVAPFVFALFAALLIEPAVNFLFHRLRFRRGFAAFAVIILFTGIIGGILWWVLGILIVQIRDVIENYDMYYNAVNERICVICRNIDSNFGLEKGTMAGFFNNAVDFVYSIANEQIMPKLMGGSINAIKGAFTLFGVIVIFFMAVFFIVRDKEKFIQYFIDNNKYLGHKLADSTKRIGSVIVSFVKTEIIIIGITIVVCSCAMLIIKNPYWLLLGIIIGLVDAFPILGTGTVFVPWAIFCAIGGNFFTAVVLMTTCLICYFIRQFLEPKLMGAKLGVHPFFMLVALYVGIVLFGIGGVIIGPIMVMVIKEMLVTVT